VLKSDRTSVIMLTEINWRSTNQHSVSRCNRHPAANQRPAAAAHCLSFRECSSYTTASAALTPTHLHSSLLYCSSQSNCLVCSISVFSDARNRVADAGSAVTSQGSHCSVSVCRASWQWQAEITHLSTNRAQRRLTSGTSPLFTGHKHINKYHFL